MYPQISGLAREISPEKRQTRPRIPALIAKNEGVHSQCFYRLYGLPIYIDKHISSAMFWINHNNAFK